MRCVQRLDGGGSGAAPRRTAASSLLTLVPLWDAELAAAEVRRNAARGVRAVAFSDRLLHLGLPSIHTDEWDPFLAACDETGTVIAMHIGSSSRMPSTSADAPPAVGSTITFANCCFSMVDWLMSGKFERFPNLKIMYAEGQIGWIPYILERALMSSGRRTGPGRRRRQGPPPASELFADHVYGCFFDDAFGLKNLDAIGVGNVLYETDYPHSDSAWPKSREVGEAQMGHLAPDVVDRIVRGNAIDLLGLTDDGLWAGARRS
ncbi:Amidohydrolase OS=Streptomyces microflavus OX=1919 GN=Smic_47620 PE=4 SV=1 [Streptomyces microflavus]